MERKWKCYLFLACFLWAISFIATKVALESAPPLTVAALRLVIAGICFLVWFLIRRRRLSVQGARGWWYLLALSGLGMGHYAVQTTGLQFTTASNASLYAVTGPIAILLLAVAFLHEELSLRKFLGLIVALVGVLTVMGFDQILAFEFRSHLWGDLLVLTSIFMWSAFTVFGKRKTDSLGPFSLTAVTTIMGALWMIPVGGGELWVSGHTLSQIRIEAWLAISFLGVGCSFLATLLWFVALKHSESQKVGVYLYSIPPMTAVLAAIFLGEPLGLNLWVGGVLVVAGVYLTDLKSRSIRSA